MYRHELNHTYTYEHLQPHADNWRPTFAKWLNKWKMKNEKSETKKRSCYERLNCQKCQNDDWQIEMSQFLPIIKRKGLVVIRLRQWHYADRLSAARRPRPQKLVIIDGIVEVNCRQRQWPITVRQGVRPRDPSRGHHEVIMRLPQKGLRQRHASGWRRSMLMVVGIVVFWRG